MSERELLERHLDRLVELRDDQWHSAHETSNHPDASLRRRDYVERYAALDLACNVLRERLR